MQCWMLWHGGPGYAPGEIPGDLERFDSLWEAVDSFDVRADSWNTYYPLVSRKPAEDGGQSAWIFFYEPGDADPYPDRIIEYGPRGGLHVTRT